MIRILLCLIASAALAFPATTAKPVAKSQHAAVSDAQIDQALKAKLSRSKIGANHFTFRVQGGVVYWDGTTNVIQHKGAATRMARSAGARAVVNNIRISEAARLKARENLASGRRRVQVKRGEERGEPGEAARSR